MFQPLIGIPPILGEIPFSTIFILLLAMLVSLMTTLVNPVHGPRKNKILEKRNL